MFKNFFEKYFSSLCTILRILIFFKCIFYEKDFLSLNEVSKMIIKFPSQKFLEELSSKSAEDTFCDDTFFRQLFFDLENKDRLSKLNNTVCNEEGKKFLSDVYNAMELQNFSRIVSIEKKERTIF